MIITTLYMFTGEYRCNNHYGGTTVIVHAASDITLIATNLIMRMTAMAIITPTKAIIIAERIPMLTPRFGSESNRESRIIVNLR